MKVNCYLLFVMGFFVFLFFPLFTIAQTQTTDTFHLSSRPYYDEFGNFYRINKEFDHLPSGKDSIEFEIESKKSIQEMMDSVKRADYPEKLISPADKRKKRD